MAHVIVMDWERVLLFIDGRLDRVLEPGRHRLWRTARTKTISVDMRPRLMTIAGQELLTADGVTLRVSVHLTWRAVDARTFVLGAESAPAVLYAAAQDAIRDTVGALAHPRRPPRRPLASLGRPGRDRGRADRDARDRARIRPGS